MDMTESGGLLKPQLFFVTIPQVTWLHLLLPVSIGFFLSNLIKNLLLFSFKVDGGCDISLKVSWSQKLLYKDGQFAISVPFHFPHYVTPFAKIFSKREKIQLNVNTSNGKEVVIQRTSHAFKVNIPLLWEVYMYDVVSLAIEGYFFPHSFFFLFFFSSGKTSKCRENVLLV